MTSSPPTAGASARGADRLVSIHLSAELSSTWDAARLAAAQVGEHLVTVVDSRSAAMGMRLRGARRRPAAAAGARTPTTVAEVARDTAAATRTFFVVDTLEHLRRGGRIGSAAALLGTALAVKPVLHVRDGRVVPLEKVRTSARAVNRLVQHAVETADDGPVSVAVHHLAAPERAERLAAELRAAAAGAGRALRQRAGRGDRRARRTRRGRASSSRRRRRSGRARSEPVGGLSADCERHGRQRAARSATRDAPAVHSRWPRPQMRRDRRGAAALPSVRRVPFSARRSDDADVIRARLRRLLAEAHGGGWVPDDDLTDGDARPP